MVVPASTSGSGLAIRGGRGGGVVAETVQTESNSNNKSDSSNLRKFFVDKKKTKKMSP